VLNKCANPVCSNQFRYLHQGKLFEVEVQYNESQSSDGETKPGNGKGHVERCWLCDQCAANITLRFDARRGAVMVSSLRSSEEALTTVLSQSNGGSTARIVRVLIRPLDLELRPSTRRRTARELDNRRREAA
jgi:transposase-like protein